MKKVLFISLFILPISVSYLQAQGVMSLDDCLKYAQEHNVNLKQKNVDIAIRQQNLFASKNSYLPDVKAEVAEQIGYGNISTASGMINSGGVGKYTLSYTSAHVFSSMPLYTGGALKNQKEADQFSIESAMANWESARKDLSIQISAKYLQALYYKNMAEVTKAQCVLSQELLDKAKIRVSNGKSPVSEQANVEAKLAADQYQLAQDEGNAILAKVSLAQLLDLPSPETFDITDLGLSLDTEPNKSCLPASADVIYNDCVSNYPTIIAAKADIDEAEAKVKIEKSKRLPQVDLRASLATNLYHVFNKDFSNPAFIKQFFDKNHAEIIGVHATFPIFNRWATRVAINKAKLNVENLQYKQELLQQNLRNDIQEAYYNAQVSISKYKSAQKAKEASDVSFNFEKEKYNAGRSTIFDLNEENQKWVKAQQDELQAKYEYLIRMKILDFYTK